MSKGLKVVTKTVHTLDYGDLEDFVQKTYKVQDYSFVATQECGNDSSHEFKRITNAAPKDQWEKIDQDLIREGEVKAYRNDSLLQVLCQDGHIPSGDYLVNVYW